MLIWMGIKKRRAAKAEPARAAAAGSFTPPAPLPVSLGIRSWRHRMAEHDLRQRVEVSDGDRTVATAEVITSEGSGGTARVSLRAEPGHITPGRRACLVDACWIFPRCSKAHAWRRHSGLAMASHCAGSRSAARTSVPARPGGARSSMRTFRPAAPGSTSRTQPARNPCRAHNDVRGDRPVRQPRRRPGQHETGQHIGPQRRQILRRHRRPRHPQSRTAARLKPRACSPSPSQQNERSGRYTFRNPKFTSDGRTRIDRARRPQVLGLQRHGRAQGTLGLF